MRGQKDCWVAFVSYVDFSLSKLSFVTRLNLYALLHMLPISSRSYIDGCAYIVIETNVACREVVTWGMLVTKQ